MKFLFKLIVMPILMIVAIPLLVLALLYKSVEIPIEDFEGTTAAPLSQMIEDEMDAFLVNPTSTSSVNLSIAQSDANAMLKAKFLETNPNYMKDGATDDEKYYVLKEEYYGYQGSWVRFKDDIVEIESGAHVFVSGFTYKTRLLITFKLTVDTDEIVLKLEKLTIGNMPLAWTFSTASWIAEKVTGQDIKGLIDDQLGGLATFDAVKREVRIDVDKALEQMMSDDPASLALINSLLAFIEENDLLDIGFTDGKFGADLNLGKTVDNSTVFTLLESQKILNDAHLQSILASKASAMIFSTLGSTNPTPFIDLDQFTLNRVFEYFMREAQVSNGVLQESPILGKYTMRAYVPYVTISGGSFVVNIPVTIEDTEVAGNKYQTIIKIDATPEIDGNDLRIVLNTLAAGEVTLGNEHMGNILTVLGNDNGFIVDGAFVIENFDEQMNAAGMSIQSVAVTNNSLRLYVSLSSTIPIQDIQNAVEDVLNAIANNPSYPPELNDAINNVIGSLLDPEVSTEEAIENLVAAMDGLSDEEQEELYNDLVAAFADTSLNYEDLFNIIP
ncbi:MAG: hypothetical protein Q7I99_04790 [Acholeplasmataceae bacterium]|nr:hypothetical protein [Acholeplasmataceae bacterium]